jgi:ABC-2 type transport system ATP-binding protein
MSEPVVLTRGLVRRFGQNAAIDGVDLKIGPGVFVGIVGPNGAGKTTLIHLLLGLLEPTEGTAVLFGQPSRDLPAKFAPQVQAVGDRHEPPPYFRLRDLIALQRDACPKFNQNLAKQMLSDHGMSLEARFGTLSKGQRRWVLSTLALASFSPLVIMDEPADGLDPSARRLLYEHLRQYVNELGATVLVASHVLSDLERVADEVIVLRGGRVAMHDSLDSIRDEMRELALRPGEREPDWLEQFAIVAEQNERDGRRVWLRLSSTDEVGFADRESIMQLVDQHIGVHRVNLESLFVALTEANGLYDESTANRSEAASCP